MKIKQFCTGKSSHLRILEFFHGCENAFHAQKKNTGTGRSRAGAGEAGSTGKSRIGFKNSLDDVILTII